MVDHAGMSQMAEAACGNRAEGLCDQQQACQLDERVKELKCLYDLTYLLCQPGISLDEVFLRTVNLIPPAWQYPEITCARILAGDQQYASEDFLETIWKQASDLFVEGERIGAVEVYYREQRANRDEGPFLKEKRSLLDEIADRLGKVVEQHRAQAAIESLARFPSENPHPVLRAGADGSLLYANAAAKQLLHARDEPAGKVLPDEWRELTADALRSGSTTRTDVEHNGRVFSFDVVPVRQAGYVNWYGRDVTEVRRTAEALVKAREELEQRVEKRTWELAAANRRLKDEIIVRKTAEAVLRRGTQIVDGVLAHLPVIVLRIDGRGRVEEILGKAAARFGLQHHELVGKNVLEKYPQGREQIEKALSGENVRFEARGLVRDTPVAFDTFMAFDQARGSGAVGFAIDITEHRLAEERAEALRADLAHIGRVATMGEMAAGIAHELNQPLAALAIRAEVAATRIRLGKEDSQEHRLELFDAIADQAHHAGEIIRRMRSFARKTDPHRTTVDLSEIIDEVTALVKSDLHHAGIRLTCRVEPSLPLALADKIQDRKSVV